MYTNKLFNSKGFLHVAVPFTIFGALVLLGLGFHFLGNSDYQFDAQVKAAQTRKVVNPGTPVKTGRGTFYIDIVKGDLAKGVKVVTDAGNASDCPNGCDAFPLSDYVGRNGGFAGINGTYFCPPDYRDCAGKHNSFHWFVFNNRTKTFLNADKRHWDNAGSMFIFRPGSSQFLRNPDAFGLDTNITGAIASFPTLVVDRQIVLDEGKIDDKQRTAKGNRGGLCVGGTEVMLIVAKKATVPDLAHIMQSLGCDNGINLDGGGSSALFNNGYKVGPGRKLPNAIILTR